MSSLFPTSQSKVVLFGLGSLGSLVIRCLSTGYPMIRVVAAVDNDPRKAGLPLADLYPDFADAGDIVVYATLAEALAACTERPDLLYHLTESEPARIEAQIVDALSSGINVISASEAMFYPHLRHPEFSQRLETAAVTHGVSVSGVGINPGFSFDAVPLALARATSGVRRVTITRAIDVTGTGPGDIEHVGYGLNPAVFSERIASGQIVGHMGMPESIVKIAEHLGIAIDHIAEGWETETTDFPVDSGTEMLGMIPPGHVIGITQTGSGYRGDEPVITMRLVMYYQPERFGITCADTIDIEGAHHIRAALTPAALSLFGAANTIVNATADVIAAAPGFFSILEATTAGAPRNSVRYTVAKAAPGRIDLAHL